MKKISLPLIALAAVSFMLTSCGTIAGSKAQIALVEAPRGVSVKANGETVDIKYEETVSTMKVGSNGDTRNSYSSPVIKVPRNKAQTIEISAGSQKGTVVTKPKVDGNIVILDLFTGFGLFVDIATGNLKKQNPRFIDVPAVLAGKPQSEWRSQRKLKKAIKKSAR